MTQTFSGAHGGPPRSSFDRVLAAVAAAGLKYKVSRGIHIQAECPTHSDGEPSLSIDFKSQASATFVHCQASCSVDDVLAALELTPPMLYDDYLSPEEFAERRRQERADERRTGKRVERRTPPRKAVARAQRPAAPKGRLPKRLTEDEPTPVSDWVVTTTYDYTDLEGTVVHQEVRHQRTVAKLVDGVSVESTVKRFTQRWPDGRGGWVDKTPNDFEPVLYRLPDLPGWISEGRQVWLCEGAKDAERFLDLGEAASTNPSGAGNFKASHAAALAGAHVVVVMDHDLAGYRRGIKLAAMLSEAASVRLVLPVTAGRHEDASDHLDAGHGIEDFVEVTVQELQGLERIAAVEEAARAVQSAAAEAQARAELAAAGGSKAEDEKRFSGRWAAEAGKHLAKAWESLSAGEAADEEQVKRLFAAVQTCQGAVVAAFEAAGEPVAEDLLPYLEELSLPEAEEDDVDEDAEDAEDADGNRPGGQVIEHPTSGRMPDPSGQVEASKGHWAYEVGGRGRRRRGVYQLEDNRWHYKAPLPYIHARITARDGFNRPTGTHYLVSAQPDSARILIGNDELSRATWPNILGLAAPYDNTIMNAATTALVNAALEAPEVEATPQINAEGKISQTTPETLPPGYLTASPLEREAALEQWAEIVRLVIEAPKMAMALGASAFGPFQGATKRQPHIFSLHGNQGQGKSVTLRAAASIWGYPGSVGDPGIVESWNQSGQGPISYLSMLGLLPAFFDESAMAGRINPQAWGKQIYDICNGAARGRPATAGRLGYHRGRGWYGILFSAGNGQLLGDGVGAGGFAGNARRVVELAAPFTNSRAHADTIEDLCTEAYGHLGEELLKHNSVETAKRHLDYARDLLGDLGTNDEMAVFVSEHLISHIAGAAMIDEIVGTKGLLAAAATDGALEFLAEWQTPLHDADRMLDAVRDSLFQEPSCWPTVAQHLENTSAPDFGKESAIARHGVALKTKGLIANSEEWLGIFTSVWSSICADLGLDSDAACRELVRRGILVPQESSKRTGARTFQSVVAVGKTKRARVYKLRYDALQDAEEDVDLPADDETDHAPAPANDHASTAAPEVLNFPAEKPEVTPQTRGVTPGVTGGGNALTCEVTGVTGVTALPSHTGERARKFNTPAPEATSTVEVLTKLEDLQACIVCGEPTRYAVDGVVVHGGDCVDQLAPAGAPAPPVAESAPAVGPATEAPARPKTTEGREPRFTAPAACIDANGIHLADGTTRPFPEISHLGDLAALTGREELRLGWGGGEDRLPDPGQIWLTATALERLGLPATQPSLPDKALTKAQRAKETAKIFAKLDDHPMVAGALEAGWQLGQRGHLDVWTRIWHPELLPGGAFLVGLPWHRIEGVALFADEPAPSELARRLLLFAQRVGVSYRITSAATGLDLIDHHRPPRRSIDDDRGQSRNRVSLIRNTPAEIPPWRVKTTDARFTSLEQDFSWWRPWDTLPESERGLRYVHGYDRNASYLTPWRSLELGVEDLVHRTGDAAAWDGKERPGYYLIDAGWEWPAWGLPDPGEAAGARVGGNRAWVTVHTLKQLKAHGITPNVHESYTWGVTARYLEGPGTRLAEARTVLAGEAPNDAGAAAVLDTVKAMYSATVGKLAEREHRGDFHLWRPDWRDHVIGASKTAILHTITKAQEISGASPLVVDRDAIFYASDEPDPIAAWPGDPTKLGSGLGAWKHIGSTELAEWGPRFLPKRTGRWHYADAVEALNLGGA